MAGSVRLSGASGRCWTCWHYRSANSEGQPEPVARPTDERRARFTSGQVDDILARVRAGGGVSREIDIMG